MRVVGLLLGTKGGASETDFSAGVLTDFGPAAPTCRAASPPAETLHSPGVWRGARLPAPAPTLRGSRPAAQLSQPSRGVDRAAPTGIRDSNR